MDGGFFDGLGDTLGGIVDGVGDVLGPLGESAGGLANNVRGIRSAFSSPSSPRQGASRAQLKRLRQQRKRQRQRFEAAAQLNQALRGEVEKLNDELTRRDVLADARAQAAAEQPSRSGFSGTQVAVVGAVVLAVALLGARGA